MRAWSRLLCRTLATAALLTVAACSTPSTTSTPGTSAPSSGTAPPATSAPAASAPAAHDMSTMTPATSAQLTPLPPSRRQIAADLPLLPEGLDSAVRPVEVVKAVYEFAARHPEVLKYVPCFCGCERSGHRGNDDCFVAARNGNGQVTQWEAHGMVCEVCVDVAQMALQMHNGGASTAAIRDAVEKRFAATRMYHTPTPPAPTKGSGKN